MTRDRIYQLAASVDDPNLRIIDRALCARTEPPLRDDDDEPVPSTVPMPPEVVVAWPA